VPAVAVRLAHVVKRFGDVAAVDGIDLDVDDGEFFSLLGPSGCGKTTTLRMIGGFEQPTSGLIELQGTAERAPFGRDDLDTLLDLATGGTAQLVRAQKAALGPLLEQADIPPLRRLALGPAQLDLSDARGPAR
jgi:ABC-type oligopeptide transport system ATPase subunit